MPFGPVNAPAVYTAIMSKIREEAWARLCQLQPTRSSETDSKQIIDDGLMWSYDGMLLLDFFECVCHIYVKYRLSFNLKKCDFFLTRFEWVGHDLTEHGNCPASSKFDLVRDWPRPNSGTHLNSFLGFLGFYSQYIPQFSFRVSPLRAFSRRFHRCHIPDGEWSSVLDELFLDLKKAIVSDPCLARYSSALPTFLKTDWSGAGMSFILMQPADDEASKVALEILKHTGTNLFDQLLSGARLRPVKFGSRPCTPRESFQHSFPGEAGSGRWSMGQCRRYLWGAHFYWFCDCKDVQAILYYEGPIHALSRLAQELFAYNFTCIHRPARMMLDVDALNRLYEKPTFDNLLLPDLTISQDARSKHMAERPFAYDPAAFPTYALKCPATAPTTPAPQLCARAICHHHTVSISCMTASAAPPPHPAPSIVSSLLCAPPSVSLSPQPALAFNEHTTNRSIQALSPTYRSCWLTVHSGTGSIAHSFSTIHPETALLPLLLLEASPSSVSLCRNLLPAASVELLPSFSLLPSLLNPSAPTPLLPPSTTTATRTFFATHPSLLGIDFHCASIDATEQFLWLRTAFQVIDQLSSTHRPSCFLFSIPTLPSPSTSCPFTSVVTAWPSHSAWRLRHGPICSSFYNDSIAAPRWIIYGTSDGTPPTFPSIVPFTNPIADRLEPQAADNLPIADCLPEPALPRPSPPHHSCSTSPVQLWSLSITKPSPASITIYDPYFPIPEPGLRPPNTIDRTHFCIPYFSRPDTHAVRLSSNFEHLLLYSFPFDALPCEIHPTIIDAIIPDLAHGLPFHTALAFATQLFHNGHFPSAASCITPAVRCLVAPAHTLPTSNDWLASYRDDPDTSKLLDHLSQPQPGPWTPAFLDTVDRAYHAYLSANALTFDHPYLRVHQSLDPDSHSIALIVVPTPLRHLLFDAFHASPTAAHFGRYKTLHRIRQRFFWPRMTSDIHELCKSCAHCLAAYKTTRRHSEFHFSWPISSPFFIIHVDLWSPGKVSKLDQFKGLSTHLMASMCDLTGFILCEDIASPTAQTLADLFMRTVLLKVGLCGLVVIDSDSKFKSDFESMCKILHIQYHVVAPRNHKALSVERFFRVLNKTVTIHCADRAIPPKLLFDRVAQTTAYAWNASTIDGTDIPRSVAAVGRVFAFPFDLATLPTPTPTFGDLSAVHDYLRLGQRESTFATEILQILTQDRREYHRLRINKNVNQRLFQVNDLVMARVQVQSKASINRVGKLTYQQRGPFIVLRYIEDMGKYIVRWLHLPNSEPHEYHAIDLTMVPPRLRPSPPIDTIDHRYLSTDHPTIHNPLRSTFNIKLYNDTWLSRPHDTAPPSQHAPPDPPAPDTVTTVPPAAPPSPSVAAAPPLITTSPPTPATAHDLYIQPAPIEDADPVLSTLPDYNPSTLHSAILASTDRLFFVSYLNPGALRPRWYLVQVDLPCTADSADICGDPSITSKYYVHFFHRHDDDSDDPDSTARWWPEWHHYTTDSDGILDYGKRTLFRPTTTPDPTRYIAWADTISLLSPSSYLLGPFDFTAPCDNPPDRSPSFRQYIAPLQWRQLHALCLERSITPPTLTMPPPVPNALRR